MRRILVPIAAVALTPPLAFAQSTLDPFGRATAGDAACPAVEQRRLTQDEMRAEAHARAERGTRCAMEGACEPGGAYRRDPEINTQVIAAVAADKRFRDTSVWVTTSRRWVTLQGCVRSRAQGKRLVDFVARQPRVERVFDELARAKK
jgi:osmotically-inducible protein OsmY